MTSQDDIFTRSAKKFNSQISVYISDDKRRELLAVLGRNIICLDHALNHTDLTNAARAVFQASLDATKDLHKELGG